MRDPALEGTTPTLAETIRTLIDAELVDVNTSMPGLIVSYDPATQTADIQPALKRAYYSGVTRNRPVIPGVPIIFPRGKNSHIHWPLQKDDPVQIFFSQRSLDNWKTAGGIVDPADVRKFHLSDAVAIPGGAALPQAFTVTDPEAVELKNGDLTVHYKPDGKLKVQNQTAELIQVLHDISDKLHTLCTTLSSDTVNTIFGPMPLNNFATYTSLGNQISSLINKLDSFKE